MQSCHVACCTRTSILGWSGEAFGTLKAKAKLKDCHAECMGHKGKPWEDDHYHTYPQMGKFVLGSKGRHVEHKTNDSKTVSGQAPSVLYQLWFLQH